MFSGGEAFSNQAYLARMPRAEGYARRAKLYELHHHLNHENIFGGYSAAACDLMQDILRG